MNRSFINIVWHRKENAFQQQAHLIEEKKGELQWRIPASIEVATSWIEMSQTVKAQSLPFGKRLRMNHQMKKVAKLIKQFT